MSGYDVLVILWGIVFVALWVLFIYSMNRLLQQENRHQDLLASATGSDHEAGPNHPIAPAA